MRSIANSEAGDCRTDLGQCGNPAPDLPLSHLLHVLFEFANNYSWEGLLGPGRGRVVVKRNVHAPYPSVHSGGEDLLNHRQGLAAVPKNVVPAPEGPLSVKFPVVERVKLREIA